MACALPPQQLLARPLTQAEGAPQGWRGSPPSPQPPHQVRAQRAGPRTPRARPSPAAPATPHHLLLQEGLLQRPWLQS